MPSVLFRGAFIRHAVLQDDDEAGPFRRIHFTADFSEPVRQHMGWEELPEGLTSGKLAGELSGTHLILTPNGRELKQHELQISCSQVNDFQVFRVKNDDGKTTHTELRFIVRSNQDTDQDQETTDDQPVLKGDETGETFLTGEAAQQHAALASKRQVEIADNGGKPPAKPRAARGPQVVN
ncbi:MAG TPA: hypothetical protein PLK67_15725 [Bryobacteraceae bacterium]|nr:hypothetical protein [Bryobacteraceae bacterium]